MSAQPSPTKRRLQWAPNYLNQLLSQKGRPEGSIQLGVKNTASFQSLKDENCKVTFTRFYSSSQNASISHIFSRWFKDGENDFMSPQRPAQLRQIASRWGWQDVLNIATEISTRPSNRDTNMHYSFYWEWYNRRQTGFGCFMRRRCQLVEFFLLFLLYKLR